MLTATDPMDMTPEDRRREIAAILAAGFLRLAERLEIRSTSKRDRWLNIAQIELSVFLQHCLDRRIPDVSALRSEAMHWYIRRNTDQKSADWRSTADTARIKPKRLYRQIQMEQGSRAP